MRYRPSRRASLSARTADYSPLPRPDVQGDPQRGDVLDALQAGLNQLAGIENLEVRGAWNLSRLAHVDDRLRAGKRQAKVDLQR